jgi:hypothetical protein
MSFALAKGSSGELSHVTLTRPLSDRDLGDHLPIGCDSELHW